MQSTIISSFELVHACAETLSIIDRYAQPDRPATEVQPRRGVRHNVSEAARGMRYHHHELGDDARCWTRGSCLPPRNQLSGHKLISAPDWLGWMV